MPCPRAQLPLCPLPWSEGRAAGRLGPLLAVFLAMLFPPGGVGSASGGQPPSAAKSTPSHVYDAHDYPASIVTRPGGGSIDPAVMDVQITPAIVESGAGIDLKIRLRNRTDKSIQSVRVTVDTGWEGPPPAYIWLGSPSFKSALIGKWLDNTRADYYGGHNFNPNGSGRSLAYPLAVIDDGRRVLSIATDYAYPFKLDTAQRGPTLQFQITGDQNHYAGGPPNRTAAPMDFLEPGEVREFTIWLRQREVSTTVLAAALDSLSAWRDDFLRLHPNQRPPRVNGRIRSMTVAQLECPTTFNVPGDNPRRYWGWDAANPGTFLNDFRNPRCVHPTTHGWNALLDAMVDVPRLKAAGFTGVMLWAPSGFVGRFDAAFKPSFWSNLPPALRNTPEELRAWQQRNHFDVYLWAGSNSLYNAGGWDSPDLPTWTHGPYYEGAGAYATDDKTPLAERRHPVFSAAAREQAEANYFACVREGGVKGLGIDAAQQVFAGGFVLDEYREMRERMPGRPLLVESYTEVNVQGLMATAFFPWNTWDRARCPLLESMYPGFQNFVFALYQDFKGQAEFNAFVVSVERAGFVPIIGASPENISALGPFEGKHFDDIDVFAGHEPKPPGP